MRLLSHFPAIGVSNTYVLGPSEGGPALLVDPGCFDVELLNLIESNNLTIDSVLVTHNHRNHIGGLRTLLKIYNAEVFAGNNHVLGFKATNVVDGMSLSVSGMNVKVLDVEGHSTDSRVFQIGPYLFTGDVLSAGRVGSSENELSRGILLGSLEKKIMAMEGDILILPGHGPPTTVAVEKKWNPDFRERGGTPDID